MTQTAAPALVLQEAAALIPYARNSNKHPPAQIAKLKASLVEYGWTNPVLVDGLSVVAGHGRLMAVAELYKAGVQIRFPDGRPIPLGFVPTLSCAGWSDAKRRAYVIADNRIAQDSELDDDMLALELADLRADDFDLSLTGLDASELDDLLGDVKALGDMPDLPQGNKSEFEQMTFTLHQDQAELLRDAIATAKSLVPVGGPNKNANGNALAFIVQQWMDA
jgi:ParB-like chromosome segregation protein Spo0J